VTDEQWPASESWPTPRPEPAAPPPDRHGGQSRIKRALAPLTAIGAFLAKFGAVLVKLKALTVVGTMAISVVAYASLWGWKFGLGIVLLIAVHELGHVVVLRARGIKAGLPVFLPFLGAFVSMKSSPRSAYEEAESALAGPLVGTLGALAVAWVGHETGSTLLRSLAFTGLLINLFNLLPALPLDGGRAAGALHPALWLLGLLALLGFEIAHPSPVVLVVLVLGAYELYGRWRNRNSPAAQLYFALTRQQRGRVALMYIGLVVVVVWSMHATYQPRTL